MSIFRKQEKRSPSLAGFTVKRLVPVVMSGLLLGAGSTVALADAGQVELKMEQFEEVVVTDAKGKTLRKLQPLQRTVPGKEVVYRISYRNKGDKPADAVVVSNPVPPQLVYKVGSAESAGTRFEVSVDGKSFGDLVRLTVPGPDGKPRPARAEDVKSLRWTVLQPVRPGAEGSLGYRAVVK